MDDNILIKGVEGKTLLIPIDTDIEDLSSKLFFIHFENREYSIKGELEAEYEDDGTLGDCAKYTIDGTEDFYSRSCDYNCWVVITNAAGEFIDKTEPAIMKVHYAPTIPGSAVPAGE